MRRIFFPLLIILLVSACTSEVTGPEPRLSADPDQNDNEPDPSTDPTFLCNENEGQWVTLHGDEFSPLVIDAIASDAESDVDLPELKLSLSTSPTGEGTDQDFEVLLQSPLGSDDGSIRWIDSNTLKFYISADLELPPGVYDLLITNPNGETSTKTEAFGMLPRPTLTTAIPEMTCVAQGQRELVLEGDNLLIQGDDVPGFTIDGQSFEVLDMASCRDLHPTFGGHQLCEEATVLLDESSLEPGVYPVSVQNIDPAGCSNLPEEDAVTLTITAPPTVDSIAPTPVCSEQLDNESVEVEGSGFVVLRGGDETIYPTVTIGENVYTAFAADGCEAVEDAPVLDAERCTQLTIAIDAGDLSSYLDEQDLFARPNTVVQNPEPVGCHSIEDRPLTVVPPPAISAVTPDPICTAQYANTLTIDGRGFLTIGEGDDEKRPQVRVDSEIYEIDSIEACTSIENDGPATLSCEQLTFTIPAADFIDPTRANVSILNPATAACESITEASVRIVAPPMVSSVQPQPICTEQQDRSLEISGEGFLEIDGALPMVSIGGLDVEATDLEDCNELPLDDETRTVLRCDTLFVDVQAGLLDAALHDVVVTNPETAACESHETVTVESVPAPEISSVSPRAVCTNEGTSAFAIEGNNLYEVDGIAPQIVISGQTYETTAGGCTDVDGSMDTRRCTTLEVDVNPGDLDGVTTMVAINPDPVGCESADSEPFYAAGAPSIASADPNGFCQDDTFDGDLSLFGRFVYDPAGALPTVTVDGTEVAIDEIFGCEAILDDFSLEACDGINVTVPESLIEDDFTVTVFGSNPVACGEDSIVLERTVPPTIDAVIPGRVCSEGTSLVVEGQNIHPDAEFYLNGVPADDGTSVAVDGSSATVVFSDAIPGDFATFEVVNPGDCGSTHTEELRVTDGPLPVFVDPPVVFDEMNTQVTIYAAGLFGGSIDTVELVHPDGSTTVLDHSYEANRPGVVQATIPEGILAELDAADFNEDGATADFGIRLTDQEITCSNQVNALVTITSELTVALESIDPPFGAQDQSTAVEIFAATELEDDETQFETTPRAYLNPVDGSGDSLAREIRSVQFLNETTLNGIVPSGLPVGFYDVIVVNPDGSVGVLSAGFQVTEQRPPLIDSVSPGSWTTGETNLAVDIEGQNFRDEPEDPTIEVFCQESGSDETDEDLLNQPLSIDVVNVADELISVTVNTDGLSHLDACYMRVTNGDGTFDEYSPITVTNPAGNFISFQPGNAFDTARRGPTLFSGVVTRKSRYLYVIGGDEGTQAEALSSGEFARLNRFGAPQSWDYLPYDLPSGRTLANGVRIEDFLYLVGGSDGGGASNEVLRAQVLDPLDSPEIVDIDLEVSEQFQEGPAPDIDGLDSGVYYYRVAAVYSNDDPANPNGESLASEPQPISLPIDDITVTISWTPPTHINHDILFYRVYRSVDPDDPYGNESLLYETDDANETSFTDDGTEELIEGMNPLAQGALGMWHQVATLNHGRMVAGITSAENPDDSAEHFIYAIGGEDDQGNFRDDYEFVSVDIYGPRDQDVFDAVIGMQGGEAMVLPDVRAELQAVTAHEGNSSAVADVAPQVFTIAGQTQGGGGNNTYVSTVGADGHLAQWSQTTNLIGSARYGHAAAAINNNLVTAGGTNGDPSTQAYHSQILCGGDCPPAAAASWISLSNVNMEERVWMGHLAFRGFWYLGGGLTTGNIPSNTVDYSVAGGTP